MKHMIDNQITLTSSCVAIREDLISLNLSLINDRFIDRYITLTSSCVAIRLDLISLSLSLVNDRQIDRQITLTSSCVAIRLDLISLNLSAVVAFFLPIIAALKFDRGDSIIELRIQNKAHIETLIYTLYLNDKSQNIDII